MLRAQLLREVKGRESDDVYARGGRTRGFRGGALRHVCLNTGTPARSRYHPVPERIRYRPKITQDLDGRVPGIPGTAGSREYTHDDSQHPLSALHTTRNTRRKYTQDPYHLIEAQLLHEPGHRQLTKDYVSLRSEAGSPGSNFAPSK